MTRRPAAFVFAFLAILFSHAASAQDWKTDSLRKLIRTLPEDTHKIYVYNQYAILQQALNLDSAGYYYLKAEAISRKHGNVNGLIDFASNYSVVLNLQGRFEESFKILKEGLALSRRHERKLDEAKMVVNVGNVFSYLGRYDSALTWYLDAAALMDQLKEKPNLNILYLNIGTMFEELEQYEQAMTYADKAIRLSEEAGDTMALAAALINSATALTSLKRYGEAMRRLERALPMTRQQDFEVIAYYTIGEIHVAQGRRREAVEAFDRALKLAQDMKYDGGMALAFYGLALANFKDGDHAAADRYAMEGIELWKNSDAFFDLRQQYKLLADIKAQLKQYPAAYEYLSEYARLNDSLVLAGVHNKVQELEKKYQVAQKDKTLAEQQLQLELGEKADRRKNTWLMLTGLVIVALGVILLLLRRNFRHRQKLQREKMEALERQQELVRLKALLEGQQEERRRIAGEMHDEIGPGLTTIQYLGNALTDAAEKKKIQATAAQLVTQMSEIIWAMSAEQDTLEALVAYLRYHAGEQLQTAGIDYVFDIPEEIPESSIAPAQRRAIYLVVKEAVHNIVKHSGATEARIRMEFGDGIRISIRDNGRGMDEAQSRTFGNGLRNMEQRMREAGGEWRIVQKSPLTIELFLPKMHFHNKG